MFEFDFNCPKEVDKMPATKRGKYCNSCSKDIVDFSEMSNTEISTRLSQAKGKMCGVFKPNQIKNGFGSKMTSEFRMAFFLVFFMGMSSSQLFSQDTLQTAPAQTQVDYSNCANCFFELKGTVTNEEGETLPFVKIWVDRDSTENSSGRIYAQTDIDGKYRMQIPAGNSGELVLYAAVAFHDTTLVINIPVKGDGEIVLVDVVMNEVMEPELHWIGVVAPIKNYSLDPYEIGKTRLDGDDIRMWD